MVDLINSIVSSSSAGRTVDHPVDGVTVSKERQEVYLHVQHTVLGIGSLDVNMDRRVGLFRYTMQSSTLRGLTHEAKQHLASAKAKHYHHDPLLDGHRVSSGSSLVSPKMSLQNSCTSAYDSTSCLDKEK